MKTLAERLAPAHPTIDMHGYTWGRWTVISRAGTQRTHVAWLCKCECGVEVTAVGTTIRSEKQRRRVRCWRCDE